jgi:hypothetical protein
MSELKVWHIPQVPMDEAFEVPVQSPEEAILVMNALAHYDLFQLANNIKPDFSNAQGLVEWSEEEKEWLDWFDDEGDDIDQYADKNGIGWEGTVSETS